ncbi:MAG: hypothetical protein QOG43_2362 [Actinomycetota bacterium]|jgi:hypothetical protein|nr:hypothetical protein [Actinomycetota bacterium]
MVAVQHRSRAVSRRAAPVEVVPFPLARPRPAPAAPLSAAPARPATLRRPVSPSTYRRRQALAAGTVAALSAVASVVLGALGGGSLTAPERPLPVVAGHVYQVQPGDTFWAIARSIDPGADPRPLVDRMVAEHGGPVLVVGEQLELPAVG